MIPLALAVAVALGSAQEAFDRGDYVQAEALALQGERTGSALYLAALARFRGGDPAGALDLLDQARLAHDPPARPLWSFNRGACLYQLGRYAEAEAAYLEAARDESLAVLALVDAGFAALDGGAPARARALSSRARAKAVEPQMLELVADLDAHLPTAEREKALAIYKDGLDAYDKGDYPVARERFLRAVALDPSDGRSRIMAAASAFRLGEAGPARAELDSALRLNLDAADAQTAHAYLDLLTKRGRWQGSARFAAGFDSNPRQTGLLQPNEFVPESIGSTVRGSPLTSAEVGLAFRAPANDDGLIFGIDYSLNSIAYTDALASDRSLQQHFLALSLQMPLGERFQFGVHFGGEADFTGLGDFRALQTAARVGGFLSFAETRFTNTRLDLAFSRKEGGADEFSYLTGNRGDVALSQELNLGPLGLFGGYAFRLEDIGDALERRQSCQVEGRCGPEMLEAFGYRSHTFWASARVQPVSRISIELSGGVEKRSYLSDDQSVGPGGNFLLPRREDRLFFAGAALSLRTGSAFAISIRYDVVNNLSNLGGFATGGPGPGGLGPGGVDHNYYKQVMSIGTLFWW